MFTFLHAQPLGVNIVAGLVGMAFLILAADHAVKRLIGLATYFNLSTTFMGMTVVSLATSIPEITAHLTASAGILRGTMDPKIASAIVLGANIGSDVVQQTLILGIVVFAAGSLYFRRYFLWKSMLPMIGAHVLCLVLGWNRYLSRWDGLILFSCFIAYTFFLYHDERKFYKKEETDESEDEKEDAPETGREAVQWTIYALMAMAVTVVSANLVLHVTEDIVKITGIGGSLIGVVTLGVASALPELTTALSGLGKKAHGITLGTLIGSNITNPLLGVGLGALVSGYWVPDALVHWDLPAAATSGLILWGILWITKGRLNRAGAVYLMLIYAVYIGMRFAFFAVD
jgi:cation:H+ antiporter